MPSSRVVRLFAAALLCLPALAYAAAPITGTVINKTTGKPSAGDDVVLIQLRQGMQESTRTTTDAHGHFTLEVPDEGPGGGLHLVRVTHQKAAYFQPVQPGGTTAEVTVYDAAPEVPGVSLGVEELHVEATPNELQIVEVLQVLNNSAPQKTQFGPSGFEFYLPQGALIGRTGAVTQNGMPVQTPAVPRSDPGHYSFLFPLRPGETQFGIGYSLPYTGKYTFTPRLTGPVKTFAVLVPDSITLTAAGHVQLSQTPGKPGTKTYLAQDVTPENPPSFTVSGTGSLPAQAGSNEAGAGGDAPNAATANPSSNAPAVSNSDLAGGRGLNNPLDEGGDRDPWAKYKWWILSALALLLAGGAGVLLRRPSGAPAGDEEASPISRQKSSWPPAPYAGPSPVPVPAGDHDATLLQALKEELFALETERLQQRITEREYTEARAAFDLILRRTLARKHPGTQAPAHASAPATESSNAADLVLPGQSRA